MVVHIVQVFPLSSLVDHQSLSFLLVFNLGQGDVVKSVDVLLVSPLGVLSGLDVVVKSAAYDAVGSCRGHPTLVGKSGLWRLVKVLLAVD